MSVAAVAALSIGATGAGAATIHRFAVSQTTGSLGSSTFLQPSASMGALQGEVSANANTTIKIPFGVLGEYDAAGSTFGIGVAGISTTGYAVGAEALGAQPAVIALGKGTGDGLDAYSAGSGKPAIYAEGQGADALGLEVVSDSADGIMSSVSGNDTAAVYGSENASEIGTGVLGSDTSAAGSGVTGVSTSGAGVIGESDSGGTAAPALGAATLAKGTDLIQSDVITIGASGETLNENFSVGSASKNASGTIITTGGAASGDIQDNGDLYLSGHVYTSCTGLFPATAANCESFGGLSSVARSNNGADVTEYASRNTSATMEDEGEARLVNGSAHVALDPAFAATISTAQPYLVFTTPRGDNRGLYVTNVTASGFDVRESASGRSTLAFDYRIVAHPYGDRSQRLAVVHPARASATRTPVRSGMSALLRTVREHVKTKFVRHAAPKSLVSFVK